jgi:hypothetical protein
MSTLLKEAFIDAKALRDVALKNAEATIVEKYSDEVRKTLDDLLEQDELLDLGAGPDPAADPMAADPMAADPMAVDPMGGEVPAEEGAEEILEGEDVPLSATDGFSHLKGKNLGSTPDAGEVVEVDVDLDALQETIRQLQEEEGMEEDFDINEEELASMLSGEEVLEEDDDEDAASETKEFGEDIDIPDELIDSIMEKMTVDMGAELSGWAGRPDFQQRHEIERELAHRRSTDVEKELKDLKKAQEELVFENKQLKEQIKKYKQAAMDLKEGMQDVNISNARLLYTNRVLRNTSLNERQKDKIAEAISNAGSVMEAKTIYETLESATPAHTTRAPQSLSEAINRPSSVIRASRKESTKPTDPFLDRMKKLAGIN